MIKVWDPLLRLFHWSLAASIAIAFVTSENGDALHEWVGYGALGLIGFRLIWGLIGPRYARFAQFVAGPQRVLTYTRDMIKLREKRYIGHNPLGAMMVVAILATTAATGVTGWLMTAPGGVAMLPGAPALVAPAFADAARGGGYWTSPTGAVKDIHEAFANLLLVLIFLHVAGVIYASRRHREKLVLAMLTGQKPAAAPEPAD